MNVTSDDAARLAAQLLARRWLPRSEPLLRRALIDAELWRELEQRLAAVGLRPVDNVHADHVSVALLRGIDGAVFGERGLNANTNFGLPRDGVALLVIAWALIVLPKRQRQASRSEIGNEQAGLFPSSKPLPRAAEVAPTLSFSSLLADFGKQLGGKTRMAANLSLLERHGFLIKRGDEIAEGPLLDLLLDYDLMASRILDGSLGDVLARARAAEAG